MVRAFFSAAFLLTNLLNVAAAQQSSDYQAAHISWDSSTQTLIQAGGVYGRIVPLPNRLLLCTYELGGAVYVRRSTDEGHSWSDPMQVASFQFGSASNPEIAVLQNGWILLSYNERPTDGVHPYTIKICFSRDNGQTWTDYRVVYQAGIDSGTGCWEPVSIQLASGEAQLYFSNESPYPSTTEQQITLLRSFDYGTTWSAPERASFRPGHRDGMPVPIELNDGSGVVMAIEDNGISGAFKPAIVSPQNGTRWPALESPLPAQVYAGAPYLRQFPTGETILALQSAEGRNSVGTLDYSRMMVYIGDSTAHGFTNGSEPFAVALTSNGLWNSLFIKNQSTVTAISSTTIDGVSGLWAIDGHLEYANASPAIQSIVNGAGGPSGPVAPGEIVSIVSAGASASSATTVYFDGLASPVSYNSNGAIQAVVPYGISNAADAVVDYGGTRSYPFPLGVAAAAPEIFTQADGSAQVVATNGDSTFNSPGAPASKGTYISFWATGQGQVRDVNGYATPVLPVSVTMGGVEAEISFAGLIYTGVLQVNIKIPDAVTTGDAVPVVLTVGSASSHKSVTVAVR